MRVMLVAVEDQPRMARREQAVQGGRVGNGGRVREAASRLIEGIVQEGDRYAPDFLFDHPGPLRHDRAQRWVELGVDPAQVRYLPLAHPLRPGVRQPEGEPGVVVAHNQAHPRFVEKAVEHLGGERADPNGVARVVDGLRLVGPDRRERGVEGGEIGVGVSR